MKKKPTSEFTQEEKNWMDTLAVNYILAQADGFQLGYGQAIHDLTENIIDYWKGSDDTVQESVLNTLVDLGVELNKRQEIARKNAEEAKKEGYEKYYSWQFRKKDEGFLRTVSLFTKDFEGEDKEQSE